MDFALRAAIESMAQQKVFEASQEKKSIPFNPDAALYRTADNMGLGDMKTDEIRFAHDGETYIAQGFGEGILWVREGDWGDIRKIGWPAANSTSGGMVTGSGEGNAGQSSSGTEIGEGGASAGRSSAGHTSRWEREEGGTTLSS